MYITLGKHIKEDLTIKCMNIIGKAIGEILKLNERKTE